MNIMERVKAESPMFFKKLRSLMIKIGCGSASIIAAKSIFSLDVPVWIITVCTYIILATASVYGTSVLTTKDVEQK